MRNSFLSVKVKVFLGYITLVALASLIIWVIYTEVLQYSSEKVDFNPSTNKFKQVNAILTNLYQAEGLESNYIQTGQVSKDYPELMKTISMQIDALVLMIKDPTQQIHTYNIKKLLQMKQRNLDELSAIKEFNSLNDINRKGLKKITTDSNHLYKSKIITKINSSGLSTGDKSIDMPKNRHDFDALEIRLKQKELEILNSDRTITFQLRHMLSYLEKEELVVSFQKVKKQQTRVQKATALIILLGSITFFATIFFLINIIRDITRSQHYRKELELSKAYSESLLKSKEQFMLSLTHDLKSPLNSIIGFTGFMEKDISVPLQHRKYLQHISTASNHILKLVNDLLDITRLETGKLAIDRIPFDFIELINDIIDSFNPQAKAKNIDLQLHVIQLPSNVYLGDPARITQVFSNLISNALKFTESGIVAIHVTLLEQSGNMDKLQVEVIDTGIGISEEDSQLVFEEFNRARPIKKQYEGTGLGLTITKKIIDLLQGTITLKSQPGKGSHFTVVLPLERGEELAEISHPNIEDVSKDSSCDISGIRIWLVDDDQMLLGMISVVLKSAGAEVYPFHNPQKAINYFEKGCADLLITDIQMPGMSGVEVLKKIQEKNGGPINSIAISGKIPVQNEYDGFSAYIQKPFQPHTLIDVICSQRDGSFSTGETEVSANDSKTSYNMDQLIAYAGGDKASLNQILVSFIYSSNQNLKLFKKYYSDEDADSVAEISHKMLTVFRQLEADDIVELLAVLEQNDGDKADRIYYYSICKLVVEKIETLLEIMKKEENIDFV